MKSCQNCGFLALKAIVSGEFEEAPQRFRFMQQTEPGQFPFPLCFARAYYLPTEVNAVGADLRASIEAVVQKDRLDCPEWTPWQQGFTPKEHREMLNRKEEREWNRALVERLEDTRARREGLHLLVTVIVAGVLLFLATLAAPTLAVWVENRFLGCG